MLQPTELQIPLHCDVNIDLPGKNGLTQQDIQKSLQSASLGQQRLRNVCRVLQKLTQFGVDGPTVLTETSMTEFASSPKPDTSQVHHSRSLINSPVSKISCRLICFSLRLSLIVAVWPTYRVWSLHPWPIVTSNLNMYLLHCCTVSLSHQCMHVLHRYLLPIYTDLSEWPLHSLSSDARKSKQ